MKSENRPANGKRLSLKKTTVAKLHKAELRNIKAGQAAQFQLDTNITKVRETCGYICGDCKSMYHIPIGDTKNNTIMGMP